MPTYTLTGKDTIKINDRPIIDVADGDVVNIDYPNELVGIKTGKNGNAIYNFNETGKQADVTLRIVRGSKDDKFFNSLKLGMERDLASFSLLTGQFIKRIGDGQGNVTREIYNLEGGVFAKNLNGKENVEGDTEATVVIYNLQFSNAPRSLS